MLGIFILWLEVVTNNALVRFWSSGVDAVPPTPQCAVTKKLHQNSVNLVTTSNQRIKIQKVRIFVIKTPFNLTQTSKTPTHTQIHLTKRNI